MTLSTFGFDALTCGSHAHVQRHIYFSHFNTYEHKLDAVHTHISILTKEHTCLHWFVSGLRTKMEFNKSAEEPCGIQMAYKWVVVNKGARRKGWLMWNRSDLLRASSVISGSRMEWAELKCIYKQILCIIFIHRETRGDGPNKSILKIKQANWLATKVCVRTQGLYSTGTMMAFHLPFPISIHLHAPNRPLLSIVDAFILELEYSCAANAPWFYVCEFVWTSLFAANERHTGCCLSPHRHYLRRSAQATQLHRTTSSFHIKSHSNCTLFASFILHTIQTTPNCIVCGHELYLCLLVFEPCRAEPAQPSSPPILIDIRNMVEGYGTTEDLYTI